MIKKDKTSNKNKNKKGAKDGKKGKVCLLVLMNIVIKACKNNHYLFLSFPLPFYFSIDIAKYSSKGCCFSWWGKFYFLFFLFFLHTLIISFFSV